jgi:hypothetical protein
MHKDALVQLGIASVSLNTSQTEKHCRAQRAYAYLRVRRLCLSARNIAHRRAMLPVRLYPMQDQVCHSRTPI